MSDLAEILFTVSSSHNKRVCKISSQSDIGKYVFQTPAFREITNKFRSYHSAGKRDRDFYPLLLGPRQPKAAEGPRHERAGEARE